MLKIIFKQLAYILNALSHVTQPQSFKNDKFTLSFMILYIVVHILLNDAGICFFLRVLIQTGVKKNQAVYQDK